MRAISAESMPTISASNSALTCSTGDLGADVVEELVGVHVRHRCSGFDLGDARHRLEQRRVLERREVRVVGDKPVQQVGVLVDEIVDGGFSGDRHGSHSSH